MEGFHDVVFPIALSFGATGGPERRNEIVTLMSGREVRNARSAHARRRYDAGTGLRSLDDLAELVAFSEARRGSLFGFRFSDPFDNQSAPAGTPIGPQDQTIGAGTGGALVFQLVKAYGDGPGAYMRPITRPRPGSVRIAVAGNERTEGVHFHLNADTGVVAFLPGAVPTMGQPVTAGFRFDVPVRFDIDQIAVNLASFKAGVAPAIPLVEILP